MVQEDKKEYKEIELRSEEVQEVMLGDHCLVLYCYHSTDWELSV